MQFQINSKTLSDVLNVIRRVQQTKNALPIFECVLFDVTDSNLTVMCSDSELYAVANLPVISSDGNFSIAIPTSDLAPLKSISDQPITIETSVREDNQEFMPTTIYYLNGQFVSNAWNGEMFPRPVSPSGNSVTKHIPLMYMFDGIRHTRFAALDESTIKPQMAGVYFDMQPYGMIAVASDGSRLAKAWYKDVHTEQPFGFVMPNKAVKVLNDVFSKTSDVEEVELTYSDNKYLISSGTYTIYGALAEGAYPNYNAVIPQNPPYKAVISRAEMLGALSRVGLFADFSNQVVLNISAGTLVIESKDVSFSRSAKESMSCDYNGIPFAVAVDYRFLSEILNTMTGEESIAIHLMAENRPLTLTPSEQDENQDILYLLMPMVVPV